MKKITSRGWVDLSEIPVSLCGSFSWDDSIGAKVPFQYDDIQGTLFIKEKVSAQYVKVDIPGYVSDRSIYVGQIKNGQLGGLLSVKTSAFRYNIGDTIDNIEIIGVVGRVGPKSNPNSSASKHKKYYCRCLIDGHKWIAREDHIKNGVRCPVCSNRTVLPGINDIATVSPELVQYFANKEDAKQFTTYSNKKAWFRCPNCKAESFRSVREVACGFTCKNCGDGVSYPNKFISNMLMQLSMKKTDDIGLANFCREKRFDWSVNAEIDNEPNPKTMIYDIYIPVHEIIIENHGGQHYRDVHIKGSQYGLDYQIKNDLDKKNTAIKNGIAEDRYIQLDCSKSEEKYIRRSVMDSLLPNLIGFSESDIDWDECDRFASGSLFVKACELHNNGMKNAEAGKMLQVSASAISRYVCKGRRLGLVKDVA